MTASEARPTIDAQKRARFSPGRRSAPYLAAATLLSIPCVWQEHIQANDLSSHLYNAWLANQASAGGLKGLYVVPQYTNVLFDLLLSGLFRIGGVVFTEHLAVVLTIQLFFWGCFGLASAAGGRAAWSIAPFLAILTYGAVFRFGFFNFYMSVGFSSAAVAMVWWGRPRLRWLALPLLLAAVAAHYLPALWAAAVIAYLLAARRMETASRRWMCGVGIAGLGALAVFLEREVSSRWTTGLRIDSLFGTDQVLTFGAKYKVIAIGLLCYCILLLVRRFDLPSLALDDVALQLWILTAAACVLLPDSVWLPIYTGGFSYITIRLSLLSGILLCAAVGCVPLKRPESAVGLILLGLFLLFTYVDERALNSFERKVTAAVAILPAGSRVIATLKDSGLYIQALQHSVDRPCIGHCFDYANYEPSTTQFRLRARPGNVYVIASYDEIGAIEQSQLVFTRSDIDLYRLSLCGSTREICVSRVKPGEKLAEQEVSLVGSALGVF
jgi:hypothetical protein